MNKQQAFFSHVCSSTKKKIVFLHLCKSLEWWGWGYLFTPKKQLHKSAERDINNKDEKQNYVEWRIDVLPEKKVLCLRNENLPSILSLQRFKRCVDSYRVLYFFLIAAFYDKNCINFATLQTHFTISNVFVYVLGGIWMVLLV